MARCIQKTIKKIKNIVLFLVIICSLTSCTKNNNIPNYKDINTQEKQQIQVVNSNINVSDFYSGDLAVIPVEEDSYDENITASSSLLVNVTDNDFVFADSIYQKLYPASITKIITALVVLEQGNLDDKVVVSKNACSIYEEGAKLCGFTEGDEIELRSLLSIFLIYSGNDAGIALAEHISGSEEEFAKEMNKTSKRLGAVHSNFVNPHGLHDDNHYTTAYDLYLIFNELLNYDEFISIINKSSVTASYLQVNKEIKTHQYMNTNRYLLGRTSKPENVSVIGGKTGTTQKAGSCLILYSLDNNEKEYISVILQAESGNYLYDQMTHLLNMIE
ncbi:MAG TPA: D-alanyl-D-alanine carboxypeptidase [Clostridiales bacterium]|nr:D-alanyl-D-alanine carboxypeptidase [Clostridiales bacterium]